MATRVKAEMTVEMLVEEIKANIRVLYEMAGRVITPRYPNVLLYILPKESVSPSGLIMLAEKDQNKPVYEGIIVKTYEPFDRTHEESDTTSETGYRDVTEHFDCQLNFGDHVLFRHYEGDPISDFLPAREFRFIRDENIVGKVEQSSLLDHTKQIVREFNRDASYTAEPELLVDLFQKHYILLPRGMKPRTISGA